MKILPGGCWVVPGGSEYREEGTRGYRIPISRERGAHEIFQTVSLYDLGRAPSRRNPFAEEVLYVVRGFGACRIDEFAYPLRPQTAVYIPPGSVYQVLNTQEDPLEIVSFVCPEEPNTQIDFPLPKLSRSTPPKRTAVEHLPEPTPFPRRSFRVLVDRELDCRRVTQFVGVIPRGRGPMHRHPYEEAIHILEGEGRLWTDEGDASFAPGTSIYLPRGVSHCLENEGRANVRILGVFYPAEPPADRYED